MSNSLDPDLGTNCLQKLTTLVGKELKGYFKKSSAYHAHIITG